MATSKKVTELTAITTAASSDLVYIVHDPAGVPVSNKITVQNLLKDANSVTLSTAAYTNSVAAATALAATAYSNSIATAASYANSAYSNAVLYVNETNAMLTPNIAYTGVFNRYPPTLPLKKDQAICFTDNDLVLSTPHLYWLDSPFDTANYDLSGTETLDFRNLGGIYGQFRLGGKGEVLINDVDLHDVAVITGLILIRDLPALVTFSANSLIHVDNDITFNSLDKVDTQFNFPNLRTVRGSIWYEYQDVLENTPQLPSLESANGLNINYVSSAQSTMTFDSLTYVRIINMAQCSGFTAGPEFPALTTVNYISINDNTMTDPPLFPVLEIVRGYFYFYNHASVTTAPATPSLVSVYGTMDMSNNPSMVNGFDFSSLKLVDGDVYLNACALDETSVDYILTTFASLDGTNGTTSYDVRTIEINGGTNAPPGTAGLEAITILEARGCTVLYN